MTRRKSKPLEVIPCIQTNIPEVDAAREADEPLTAAAAVTLADKAIKSLLLIPVIF
jgi:hypothetical protein